jgi:hypothetical protein
MPTVDYNLPFKKHNLLLTGIASLIRWLEREWTQYTENKIAIRLVRASEDMRDYNNQVGDVSYPYGSLLLTNIDIDTDKAGLGRGSRSPRITGRTEGSNILKQAINVPVKVGLAFSFRTDNLNDVITLSQILLQRAPKIAFFLQNDYGFTYESSANIEPNISIPPSDLGYPGKVFTFETTFILNTYLGIIQDIKSIKKIRLTIKDGNTRGEDITSFEDLETLTNINYSHIDIYDKDSKHYNPLNEKGK